MPRAPFEILRVPTPGATDILRRNGFLDACGGIGMRLLRRVMYAVAVAATIAGALRVRGTGGTPPQHGGWRPLDLPNR